MSRRYWIGYVALAVITSGFAAWGVWSFLDYQREQAKQRGEAAQYDPERAEQQANDPCVRRADFVDGINCVLRQANAQRQDKRTGYDLQAQQEMAAWAYGLLLLNVVGLGGTVFGIFLVWQNLRESRKTTRAALRSNVRAARANVIALEASQGAEENTRRELRAYLSVEPRGINLLIKSHDVMGHVAVRTVGKIPARNVMVFVRMRMSSWRDTEFEVPDDSFKVDRVIHPEAEMRQGSTERIKISEVVAGASQEQYIFVWGIVYYDDGYDTRRFTRFCHRYDTASYNRDQDWNRQSGTTLVVINADKARYHTHGNNAD